MASVIDMQFMRYINLFSRISKLSTTNCFVYNNQIIFAVPSSKVSQAIGQNAVNAKKLREILRKKIRIVAIPRDNSQEEIEKFVRSIVEPIEFNKVEIREEGMTITANLQNKAALIGRNRVREKELSDILKNNFHIPRLRIL